MDGRRKRTVMACAGTLAVLGTLTGVSGCASGTASSVGAPPGGSASSGGAPSATSAPGGSETSSAKPARACEANQLSVKFVPLHGAAAGSTFDDVVETNTSQQACWVRHSVKLRLSDAYRQQIPIPVEEDPDPGTIVMLQPGTSAAQTVQYSSDGNPPPGQKTCTPVEKYVEITVADESQPTVLPISEHGYCPDDKILLKNLIAGDYSPPG